MTNKEIIESYNRSKESLNPILDELQDINGFISKEDISKIINNIKISKNKKISIISQEYINFLQKINSEKQTSTKNYYIIISQDYEEENQDNIYYSLNEKYLKIKECLNKCGNQIKECKKEEVLKIFHFFLNTNINWKRK